MSRFFVSCPLNFETEMLAEFQEFWFEMMDLDGLPTRTPFPETEILHGGVELEIPDHLGFQINFFSKLAGRVLLRIAKFDARYFDQFEKGFAQIDFAKYFSESEFQVKSESHKSRVNNEKSILEAVQNVFKKKNLKLSDTAAQSVLIRIERDRVTVSLDTSGEHLHRRGYAQRRGEAPLRETLAAFLLRKLESQVKIDENLTLLDPFCGSGTILFEALSKELPNFARTYSWQNFKTAPKIFKSDSWKKNFRWIKSAGFLQITGCDIDESAIENLTGNAEEFKNVFGLNNVAIHSEVLDAEQLRIDRTQFRKNLWVVTNPPYGIRMADENAKMALEKLDGKIDGLILIHPVTWKFRMKNMKSILCEDFSNQGLNLKLSVFKSLPKD